MPERTKRPVVEHGRHFSAQDVRGGEIILRARIQRRIFVSGPAGFVILALVPSLTGLH
jgi:hypothetical protein